MSEGRSAESQDLPAPAPYVPPEAHLAELSVKAIALGMVFGVIFGAATVYLALKAGLTVSASIPISVLAISVFKRFGSSTILENNIVQTIGSAGESIAAGVVFTLPGFLFLSRDLATHKSVGEPYFSYWTILTLALVGGVLGVLMMIPLRRSLIVKEHARLPYPEGTACAQVLIAGERGGDLARTAYHGLGFAFAYALLQKVFRFVAETPTLAIRQTNRYLPSAVLSGDITPEYLGVGYIIGPEIAGVLVAGGVLAWLGLIPLLAVVTPPDAIAAQLVKLGYLPSLSSAGGPGGWNPAAHAFADTAAAVYRAYVRQIGAGAVAAGGFITLLKTLPTIVSSFKESLASFRRHDGGAGTLRTERDLPISFVVVGSAILILVTAFLPFVPGSGVGSKLLLGVLIVVFGFFFVTVASRIVGLIGSSSNPISGMTIATLMATCLVFVGLGWTGDVYQPMALCVGAMVCIAAANAGATSQDLKTGFLVGATPRAQQIGLLIGVVTATVVVGFTIRLLDRAPLHLIGSDLYPAPQATLMATLIKGLLAFNLDWQFVMVGVALAATIELCGVGSLSFAVGAYLPLSTTAPVFVGGLVRAFADRRARRHDAPGSSPAPAAHAELGPGNLFATGLVAGGAVAGVAVALLTVTDRGARVVARLSVEHALTGRLGAGGYQILGLCCFATMALTLARVARSAGTDTHNPK